MNEDFTLSVQDTNEEALAAKMYLLFDSDQPSVRVIFLIHMQSSLHFSKEIEIYWCIGDTGQGFILSEKWSKTFWIVVKICLSKYYL